MAKNNSLPPNSAGKTTGSCSRAITAEHKRKKDIPYLYLSEFERLPL